MKIKKMLEVATCAMIIPMVGVNNLHNAENPQKNLNKAPRGFFIGEGEVEPVSSKVMQIISDSAVNIAQAGRVDNNQLEQKVETFNIDEFSDFALNPGAKEIFMRSLGDNHDRFKVLMMNMFLLRNNYLEGYYNKEEFEKIIRDYNERYKITDYFNPKIEIDIFNVEALSNKK